MTGRDADLEQFLEVLGKLLGRHLAPGEHLGGPDGVAGLERALAEADVLGLALETFEMDGAQRWLAEVVRAVAHSSPSLALVLAARYTAHRAIRSVQGESTADTGATAGSTASLDVADPAPVAATCSTVPGLFDPELIVLVEADGTGGMLVGREAMATEPGPKRTGLGDAHLLTVRVVGEPDSTLDPEVASAAAGDLTLLTAAAALGVAEAALATSLTYAADRRQFGSNLLSFAGMRALLGEMQLRVSAVAALLEQALETGTAASRSELAATAGRTAVDVAIDAIQVHGGYGYIDEYPVANLLRDALSLRARIARRSNLSRLAVERFGPVT